MSATPLVVAIGLISDIIKSIARYSKELNQEALLADEEIKRELERIHELSGFLLKTISKNDQEIDVELEEK